MADGVKRPTDLKENKMSNVNQLLADVDHRHLDALEEEADEVRGVAEVDRRQEARIDDRHVTARLDEFLRGLPRHELRRIAGGRPRRVLRPVSPGRAGDGRGGLSPQKRQIQQVVVDLFALPISTGMISKLERQAAAALEAPYNELAVAVHRAEVTNIDEISWRERPRKVWLWAKVTPLFTVFAIARNRSGEVARALLGSEDGQVVGSDRFGAYDSIMARWRQVCWAHLRREFRAMIDRGGDGEPVGRQLLSLSNRLFRHWHRVRDGTLEWGSFQRRMSRLRGEVRRALVAGSRCRCAKTAATCFEILKVAEGLWAFAQVKGVEPTNNAVERALRRAVLWRRISGGTESAHGSRFVEYMLSVVATCRQQGRNVLTT